MTHYFASGAAAALGLYAMLRLHGRARTFAIGSLLAAVVVFLAVWGPFIKPKDAQIGLEWLRENPQGHVIRTLGRAAVLPVRFFAELPRGLLRLSELATIAGLLPLYLLLSGKRRDLLLPVLWVICIIGSVAMLDVVRSTYQLGISRYTLLAAPGAFMLAAASLWHLRHAWRHAVPAAAVLLSAVATFRGGPFEKPDWRGLGAEIGRRVAPGELVVFAARDPARVGPLWQAQRRYICVRRYTELAESVHLVLLLSAPPSDEVRRRIDAAVADSQVWVVADSDPKSPDTLSVLPGYRLETGAAFGGAGALFRIVPPLPSAPPRS